MFEIDDKLIELTEKYYDHFSEPVSLRMLPQTMTYDQLYDAIQKCIDNNSTEFIAQYYESFSKDILL